VYSPARAIGVGNNSDSQACVRRSRIMKHGFRLLPLADHLPDFFQRKEDALADYADRYLGLWKARDLSHRALPNE
jgi:hypothetical protein